MAAANEGVQVPAMNIEGGQNLNLDPPVTGFTGFLVRRFNRNYEGTRPFFRWFVVRARYFRLFWRTLAIPPLVYCFHVLFYALIVRKFDYYATKGKDTWCKILALFFSFFAFVLHIKIWKAYERWERPLLRRRDRGRYVPVFVRNSVRVILVSAFAVTSLFIGQWITPSNAELHICTSLGIYFFFMELSKKTLDDFCLIDCLVAIVISLVYALDRNEALRYTHIALVASIPASKFALIPFANLITAWIGPIDPQDRIRYPWWRELIAFLVLFSIFLAVYLPMNVLEKFHLTDSFMSPNSDGCKPKSS